MSTASSAGLRSSISSSSSWGPVGTCWSVIFALRLVRRGVVGCGVRVLDGGYVVGRHHRLVELVSDVDVPVIRTGPAYVQVTQGGRLLERDDALAEQLEDGEEAGDLGHQVGRVR